MAKYDPAVIQRHADALYSKAASAKFLNTALGVILGLMAAVYINNRSPGGNMIGAVLALGIPTIIGFAVGDARAFGLRLQAQTALCQAAIEANTRQLLERGLDAGFEPVQHTPIVQQRADDAAHGAEAPDDLKRVAEVV